MLGIHSDTGSFVIPPAADIYSLVFGPSSESSQLSSLPDPSSIFTDIRFSKIGSNLGIILRYSDDSKIVLKPFIRKKQKLFELDFDRRHFYDHVIVDNYWVYISSDLDYFKSVLNNLAIESFDNISLAQYIRLSRGQILNQSIEIIDEAKEIIDAHPPIVSDTQPNLLVQLYPYQKNGVDWLRFITNLGSGCIVGDEMGLGKTLQVISLIVERRALSKNPCLVVAPASLLENWTREFIKFTTGLKTHIHHGSSRTAFFRDFLGYDVIITSYGLLSSDLSLFNMIHWDMVILDEAQNIKNPDAIRTKTVKRVNRDIGIAVTGTPFENHLTDVWSILDFISPGILGSLSDFNKNYQDTVEGARFIEPILTPLMLRRVVSDVAMDLPEKVVIPVTLTMSDDESFAYEQIRQSIADQYSEKAATLVSLTKLRMFCTHPVLLSDNLFQEDYTTNSSKYQYLCDILEEIILRGEKTLIFTSYNDMNRILSTDLHNRFKIPVFSIFGETPVSERQPLIDSFSDIFGAAIMVLNPKAAGTGLNITAASRVIHYTPEWNPSLEDQASARAYRRGQNKTVFIYRLYYKDTVEDIIEERMERKRDIFSAAVIGVDGSEDNREDILNALRISPRN